MEGSRKKEKSLTAPRLLYFALKRCQHHFSHIKSTLINRLQLKLNMIFFFFADLNQLCVLPLFNIYSSWRQRHRIYKWMSSWSQMLHDSQEQILRSLLQFITLNSELNLILSFALFVSTVCVMHVIYRYTGHSKCAPTSSVNVGNSPAAVSHFCPLSITLHLFPPTLTFSPCLSFL